MKTNLEQVLVGGAGTFRIDDDSTYDDLQVLSIIPESNCTVTTLVVVNGNSEEINATETLDNGGRNLTTLIAGVPYMAGVNSYFKTIKLASGEITCNPA